MTNEFINERIKEIKDLIEYSKKNMDSQAVFEMEQDVEDLEAMIKENNKRINLGPTMDMLLDNGYIMPRDYSMFTIAQMQEEMAKACQTLHLTPKFKL